MSYFFAIVGLCLLIVVHEAGHMWVARLFGMRVEKFSIFFGPPLFRWRGKTTTYQLATIPLGGFVQIAGMNPHEPLPPDDPGSYANKSAWARFATILAGPLTNYLLATILVVFLSAVWGAPKAEVLPRIDAVAAGQPAALAGIQTGDRVIAIDGNPINSGAALIDAIIASKGRPIQLTVQRLRGTQQITLRPMPQGEAYRIGVTLVSQITFTELPLSGAIKAGLVYPFAESARLLGGLKKIFTREVSTDQVGGLVEVVKQLKLGFEHSFAMALGFLAMLNVVLGLFNLLPIPALDGGRLVFLAYNIVTGQRVNQRFETIVHTIGFFLLMILLLAVNFRDVVRLFSAN